MLDTNNKRRVRNFRKGGIRMTKTEQVIRYIREYVRTHNLQAGDKIPSEYELAKRCGVNKTTANKAVARFVQQGLVERRGGAAGSVLTNSPSVCRGTLAIQTLLISGLTYGARIVRGAQAAAEENGYALQYYESGRNSRTQLEMMRASGVSGLLAHCADPVPETYPLPVVYLGNNPPEDQRNVIYSDMYAGARELTGLVYQRGHRQPVLIVHEKNHPFVQGIRDELREHGILLKERQIFAVGSTLAFNPSLVCKEIQEFFPDPGVIMCASDNLAMRLLLHFGEQRIAVPETCSVTGFGFMEEYQRLRPITSVNQFPEELGYTACKGLIDILEGRRKEIRISITPELVKGDTLAVLS